MKEIKISIIIPMLNSIQFLEECIQSVTNQMLTEIEILFVDAGSNDGSIELIQSYQKKDNRIQVLQSENKSYGYQVNLGMRAARGEYIGIVESDDVVAKDFFMNLYQIGQAKKPDFVKGGFTQMATFLHKKVYDKVQKSDISRDQWIDLNKEQKYRFFDLVHIWSGIYKREFLLENEIFMNPTKGASYQDTSFSILVALLADTCIYASECGYFYRIDNANSSVKSDEKVFCIIDEYTYLRQELEKRNMYHDYIKDSVEKYRLVSYFWNFRRMNQRGREQFLDSIADQMKQFKNEATHLSNSDLEVLRFLSDRSGTHKLEVIEHKLENEYAKLLALWKSKKAIVCIAKKQHVKKMICFQENLQTNRVKKIVESVAELMPEEKQISDICMQNEAVEYLILGKKGTEEVKKQLREQGIADDNIHAIDYLPSFSWMIAHMK